MPDPIKIKKVHFDFSMEKEELAFELNSRWATFFQSGFVKPVEKVLMAFDKSSHHLEIDRLVLDLGCIPEADFFDKFPRMLEEKLEEEMLQYLSDRSKGKAIRQLDGDQFLFEAFTCFLLNGYFSWQVDQKYKDPQLLLGLVLHSNSKALRQFLFRYGHNTALRKRLVLQLTDTQLEKLVELTEPSDSPFIISYFKFIRETYATIEQPDVEEKAYRHATWYLIFSYLLEKRGTYFNRRHFVQHTISGLGARYNLTYHTLLEYLVSYIPSFSQKFGSMAELGRILNELNEGEKGGQGALENEEPGSERDVDKVSRVFQSYLAGGLPSEKHASDLRIKLISLLEKTLSRKNFIACLAEEELAILIKLLIPEESMFIKSYAFSLNRQKEQGAFNNYSEEGFRLLKWNCIFNVLMEERGGVFNREVFVRKVLNQMQSHAYSKEQATTPFHEMSVNEEEIGAGLIRRDVKGYRRQFLAWLKGERAPETTMNGLRAGLVALLLQPLSRREFLAGLREEEICQLTELVEQEASQVVIAYARSLESEKERGTFEGQAGSEFRLLKWEFIFMALLEDRGSLFNRKSFIQSVLFMIVAHYNLNMGQVLEHFYRGIMEQKNSLPRDVADLLKVVYFEWKEQQHKESGEKLLDKVVKESQYAQVLKDYLTTGLIVDDYYTHRIYEVFSYLKTYRSDLLLGIIEELKGGFILEDVATIPSQKQLYQELIFFVVDTYSLNLPGERQVKSLFENIAVDRFSGVPIGAFKLMLAACLRNEVTLFEKAWAVLTQTAVSSEGTLPALLSYLPDEDLPCFLDRASAAGAESWVRRHQKEIYTRIISSASLFRVWVEQIRTKKEMRKLVAKTMDGQTLLLFVDKLSFSGVGELPARLIKELAGNVKYRDTIGLEVFNLLLFNYLAALHRQPESLATKQFLQEYLKRIKQDAKRDEWVRELSRQLDQHFPGSTLTAAINTVLEDIKGNVAVNGLTMDQMDGDGSMMQLMEHFGPSARLVVSSSSDKKLTDQLLCREMEQLLLNQPDRLKERWQKNVVDKPKLLEWLKTAPDSLKWKWLQVMSDTYVRTLMEHMLLLQRWLVEIFRHEHMGPFPTQVMTNLLLEYTTGKYRNMNRQQFTGKVLEELFKDVKAEKQTVIMDKLKDRAEKSGGPLVNLLEQVQKNQDGKLLVKYENDLSGLSQSAAGVEDVQEGEEIFISNAGLVLLAPYFARLFEMLDLVNKGKFKDTKAQERALLLSQYIVCEHTSFPEHELVLNKVLVGFKTGVPVDTAIDITGKEKDVLDALLKGVITNWKALKNTSVQGLRESFLMREGKLMHKDNTWQLVVEQKAYDLLLDSLPWSYSPVKNLWMDDVLYTTWR